MNRRRLIVWSIILVGFVVSYSLKANHKARRDAVFREFIDGALSSREKNLAKYNGKLSDIRVFRDSDGDGIVFEYILAEGVPVDRSKMTPATIKQELAQGMSANPKAKPTFKKWHIYTRILFKTFNGEVICEAKITADDL